MTIDVILALQDFRQAINILSMTNKEYISKKLYSSFEFLYIQIKRMKTMYSCPLTKALYGLFLCI